MGKIHLVTSQCQQVACKEMQGWVHQEITGEWEDINNSIRIRATSSSLILAITQVNTIINHNITNTHQLKATITITSTASNNNNTSHLLNTKVATK